MTLFSSTLEAEPPVVPDLAAPPTLFADVVFDRPLDHAFTYAVPESLCDVIAVGKRVEVPFGKGNKGTPGYCIRLSDAVPERAVKHVLKVLDDVALLDDQLLKLTRWMADYYLCGWGQVLHAVVPAGVRSKAGTRSVTFVEAVPREQLPDPLPTVSPKQKQVLEHLRLEGKPIELRKLGSIAGLVEKGLVRKFSERVDTQNRERDEAVPAKQLPAHTLNADQTAVWNQVAEALQTGGFKPLLLHGVTGSGKTEIYLRAIEEVVKQGKEAIVLVPEISLTPQTFERFQGRAASVAVLHSNLTDSERGGYWRRVANGQVQVVVGARSAVFAPTRNLGLIVVDEEHETSFKQETTPRYHARDVAVMRARLADVPVLLGSATPSLESWNNCQRGAYTRLSLPNRVENRPLPAVQIVDLRHEPKRVGKPAAIGPTLEAAMKIALAKGGQVMLLLNRRGFSTHIHCPGCGHVATCAHCDLAMTFHRDDAALVCHYCGFKAAPMAKCPICADSTIRYQGLGTEKLHAEVEEKFPGKVVRRMDSDTMSRPGSHERVLDAFRDGLVHILLGTQMIAKGLDFPNVTLVGVVNADVGLHVPDFRAAERTFQLLAQVAGRAGRGDAGGRVLVQTFTPEHPCIVRAAQHDYIGFATEELAHRRGHDYPPYHRMARLIVRSEVAESAGAFAEILAGAFTQAVARSTAGPAVRVLGPAECPVFKLKDLFRFHFQLQCESSVRLHEVLREVLATAKLPHGVEFQVDVDPYSMV